ncbi:hypothetical protein HZB05_00295 [Candidatus Wolfebacteria bacterium]|nr:hypothetical protein [Candidatus Wolfebacteria bacterium]
MSLTKRILIAFLSGNSFSYRQLSENGTWPKKSGRVYDIPKIKDQTLRTTLSRLKKRGLLENNNKIWKITERGLNYIKKSAPKTQHFKPQNSNSVKNMIIIFDIPELHRKKRDWLRTELINLGFSILQKSVWFGPSPLPKEFIEYSDEINILPYMKFFKAEENDLV